VLALARVGHVDEPPRAELADAIPKRREVGRRVEVAAVALLDDQRQGAPSFVLKPSGKTQSAPSLSRARPAARRSATTAARRSL
jgi:hypothetical protein